MKKNSKKNVESTEQSVEVVKPQTVRRYELIRLPAKAPKGQAGLVLAAAEQVGSGLLEDFVSAIGATGGEYKTKFPIAASVKFHLHQLARQGYIKEEDVAIAA